MVERRNTETKNTGGEESGREELFIYTPTNDGKWIATKGDSEATVLAICQFPKVVVAIFSFFLFLFF